MTINLSIDNPCEVIIGSLNILNSWDQLYKDVQIDSKTGLSSSPPSVTKAATKRFFDNIGAPSSYSKVKFLSDMDIQMFAFFNFSLYKFYFYQIKDLSDFNDSTQLSLQLDKTKQIAAKAIQEYQACMKLLEKGLAREMISFVPTFIFDYFCNYEFVNITKIIEPDLLAPPSEYADYLIDLFPKAKLGNFCLIAQKVQYIKLPFESWSIIDCAQHAEKMVPAEVFARVHHRAMEEIKYLLHQHFVTKLDRELIDGYFDTSKFFQIHKKRIEVYEQH
ncbi:hypothetical protein [Candidatus Protochlamydia sp. R18]|uniref:hypothetical protein n=1 Tax=Candidatus Protochlamydia sp. R18 TaxID=1353977 RepID=UPI0005A75239|nr:hypothetical protein [Candidatus Protochlamydia sp. R18]